MIQLLCNFIRYTNLHSIALATQTPASCLVKRFPIPCTMLWLARSMMAVRPTPKVAFWPKLRKERLVVVFKAPFSYNFSSLSYCSASKCSLLNSCIQWYRGVCVCGWMTVLQCSSQVYQMYEGVCVHVCVCVWEREKKRERERMMTCSDLKSSFYQSTWNCSGEEILTSLQVRYKHFYEVIIHHIKFTLTVS